MARSTAQDVKVGIFVLVLLTALVATLWIIGGSSDMFEGRYTLNGKFADVAGLKEGAVVRLAGWDVGEVSAIRFGESLDEKEMLVEMSVLDRYRPRIRQDSEARIETEGVLGDKYISITIGSPSKPEMGDGEWLGTRNPLNLLEYQKTATDLLANTTNISRKVDMLLGSDQEAAQASLARSFQHIEEMLAAAKTGGGLLHTLIYDEALARQLKSTVGNLQTASEGLEDVSNEIRSGDGLAHQLIYGEEGADLARELKDLAGALDQLTNDLKNEDSVVHALLYEPEKAQLVDDLAVTAAQLRLASEAISKGEGTAGLLVNDPQLYEDLRALVGGAQRNKLLRAYIRATVRKAEEQDAGAWEPVQ